MFFPEVIPTRTKNWFSNRTLFVKLSVELKNKNNAQDVSLKIDGLLLDNPGKNTHFFWINKSVTAKKTHQRQF